MLNIFQLVTSVSLGGAENVVFNLIENSLNNSSRKINCIILEVYSTRSYYALRKKVKLRSLGVKVITLGCSSKYISLIMAPFSLIAYIIKIKPDVIHSHTDLPDFVLSVAIKLHKKNRLNIVRTIHNTELWSKYFYLGKYVESSFDQDSIVGVSNAALNSYIKLRNRYNLSISDRKKVIYNGCEILEREFHTFNLDNSKINIAFCGRFVYQKGLDVLLNFINQLDSITKSAFLFHFIGDGPYKVMLQEFQLDNSNVLIYSPVSKLSSRIYDFDYIVMPSRFEGLPLLSIESSLAKVPVIASRSLGLDETLPMNWPLLFDLDNFNEFNDIMRKIASGSYEADDIKDLAFNYATKKFSIQEMILEYNKIYLNDYTKAAY